MANGTVEFFGTNTLTAPNIGQNWQFQNGGAIQHALTRVNELGKDGDELLSGSHDDKYTTSFTYVWKASGSSVTAYDFPNAGAIIGLWHIDGFSCTWSRDKAAAVLTLNCHRHGSSAHDTTRTYTPSLNAITCPAFGCPSTFGTAFSLTANAVVDLRSATYAVNCSHVDENNRTGAHLKGNNYDGVETLAIELTGSATSDDYTSTGWDATGDTNTPSNTGVTTTSFNFEHHLSANAA